ncbi:putative ribonuclease H protein [Vitis vinifera]|uniref:Putative ribonuclease H protein n=1 Tax=Vitis vinifera TaxID=29760 RepID=A0A438CUY0_VITVI|nr:putative ribonuclease H protein [Vitis vinifera]
MYARKRGSNVGSLMKLRLLSWNVRGANDSSKRKESRLWEVPGLGCFGCSWLCGLRNVEDGFVWIFTGVYGPFSREDREAFWEELGAIRGIWSDPWCIGGDFNVILPKRKEQSGKDKWLPRPTSDHFPIMLKGGGLRRGPSPFRFENMWLKVDGFKDLLREWWQGTVVRGRPFRLASKLKVEFWDRVESERSLSVSETEMKKEAKETFKKWVLLEETHWRQVSRELWLKEGDKNIGFFHRMANAHRRNNSLDRIKINGVWRVEEQEVREGIVQNFQQLLTEEPSWRADIEGLHLPCLNSCEAEGLEVPFTVEEIHSALMDMNGDKAPGPDGLNTTFLVLIPKKGGAEDLGEFRPISLLGGLYKLVPRQILDASLIANEVIDFWHKRLTKDGIWDSVDGVDLVVHFNCQIFYPGKWWVPAGFFPSSKGLRQGDPLSPYLFVLGMEVLSALIRRAVGGGFVSGCTFGVEEAGDGAGSWLGLRRRSGLRINLAKSELIPIGEVEEIEEMAVELGCKVGALPSVYLGLPLGAHHKAISMWDGVEERMRRRLALWKRQYISKGGRITLIKSTLASIPIYQLSLFRMPKLVAKRLEKLQRDFLWGGGRMERKIHLINWEVVCTQKENGGLGIRKIDLLNKALLSKWIWRFAFEEDILWKKVIGVKYGQEGLGWRTNEARGPLELGFGRF